MEPSDGRRGQGSFARAGLPPGAGEARLRAVLGELDLLVDWERRDRSAGAGREMRVDLEPARDLVERLGRPHEAFRAVHVAGTKGKGSVSALVAAALGRAGLPAGLYASPHVERLNERVRLDGAEVASDVLARELERALRARAEAIAAGSAGARATWFDVLTAAAFAVFAAEGLPWAVVECGLGGRLDSTNVLSGEVCVVTNVDLEHTAILGSTRREIALEKVGILDGARGPAPDLVTGLDPEDEAGRAVAARARELGVRVEWVRAAGRGDLASRNAALAEAVLERLGARGVRAAALRPGEALGPWALDAEARRRGGLPGRQERFEAPGPGGARVAVWLDGAHVASSLAQVLEETSARELGAAPPVVVLGLGRDKDAPAILKVLRGRVDSLVCTSAGQGPYLVPEDMKRLAEEEGLAAETADSPRTALRTAIARAAGEGSWVLVTGSLHLVGAVRGELNDASVTPC